MNPVASVHTSIKTYQKYFLKKAYIGEDVFWGLTPGEGDTVEFRFDPPIEIARLVPLNTLWIALCHVGYPGWHSQNVCANSKQVRP